MLASNQPYQRVDDGVGAGLVGGAVVGGAMAGSAHMWGSKGLSKMRELNQTVGLARSMGAEGKALEKAGKQHSAVQKGIDKLSSGHKMGFSGGWKGKAAAYGGSVLLGGLTGAVGDALND